MALRRLFLAGAAAVLGVVPLAGVASHPPSASAAPIPVSGLPDGVPPAALKPEPALPAPAGWPFPEAFPRTSGTGRLSAGAFYWSDFLYDDHGARGVQRSLPVAGLAPSAGTYDYPDGPASNNGADIFRAAIGRDGAATYWRVDWNTLVDPAVPVAEFALDTDNSATTGVAAWPGGAGVRSPGIERFLLVSGKGGWLVDGAGVKTPVAALGGSLTVDRNARSFVVRVPLGSLPANGTWKVRLAAGLANAGGDGFAPVGSDRGALPGEPPVYNLTFRSYRQEPAADNLWMDEAQAGALITGDVSAFSADVNWGELAARRTTPESLPTGYTNRWYVSSIELGQGAVREPQNAPQGDLRPNFLGRLQPYGVYVPTSYDPARPAPLTWLLHSLGVQHNQYGGLDPKFLQAACEARRSICATTLGRGPDGWYYDEAELDFWEVWNRLAQAYRLDPDRTVLSGYSMGGWGTYKLGLAYPSLFAKALPMAGPPTCGIRGGTQDLHAAGGRCTNDADTTKLIENARWLPFSIHQGMVDELVPVASVIQQAQKFDDLGYRYRLEVYPGEDHLYWAAQDAFSSVAAHMGNGVRQADPGHITLSWYPDLARPEWGVGTTGAWWVHDLAAADSHPGVIARVDAVSGARPDPRVTSSVSHSADVPEGATPDLITERTWKTGPAAARTTTLALDLRDVAALAVDMVRAGFAATEPAGVDLSTDHATRLTLTGVSGAAAATLDGAPAGRATGGALTVEVPAGHHHVDLVIVLAAALQAQAPNALGARLPATGTRETLLFGGGLGLVLAALGGRRLARAR